MDCYTSKNIQMFRRNPFLVFNFFSQHHSFRAFSFFFMDTHIDWPHGKIPKMVSSVDRYHIKRDSWCNFINSKLVFISPHIITRELQNSFVFSNSFLSSNFCQLTLSLHVIFLCMITHSILNQLHAQHNDTKYIAIILLNYSTVTYHYVTIHNQMSNEQKQ